MTEQQRYRVVEEKDDFELRRYEPAVLAEVEVLGGFGSGLTSGFRTLASYIGGRNGSSQKIAMTAPVLEQPEGATSLVAFVMPAGSDLESMPAPSDPSVQMRQVDEELVAAQRFSGRWSQGGFARRADDLVEMVKSAGLTPTGSPRYARYDPPWTPWFMRRNEVLIPVKRAEG